MAASKQSALAHGFIELLLSPAGQARARSAGFPAAPARGAVSVMWIHVRTAITARIPGGVAASVVDDAAADSHVRSAAPGASRCPR